LSFNTFTAIARAHNALQFVVVTYINEKCSHQMSLANHKKPPQDWYMPSFRYSLGFLVTLTFFVLTPSAHAENNRQDYDIDDDGLIEINDLNDLHQVEKSKPIKPNKTLYGSDNGCPPPYCFGYELTKDLDLYEKDDPEPSSNFRTIRVFTGVFEGNGYRILNMRTSAGGNAGFIGIARSALIKDLHFDGEYGRARSFSNHSNVGAITGVLNPGFIVNCSANSVIVGQGNSGGLVGIASNSTIFNSHFRGEFKRIENGKSGFRSGGVAALSFTSHIISSSFIGTSAAINGYAFPFADTKGGGTVSNSFALMKKGSSEISDDNSLNPTLYRSNTYVVAADDGRAIISNQLKQKPVAASISEIKCPTSFDDPSCRMLFGESWQNNADDFGNTFWEFGSSDELPRLNPNLRFDFEAIDIDGDGVIHSEDAFPYDKDSSLDSDFDGIPEDCELLCGLYQTSIFSKNIEDMTNEEAGLLSMRFFLFFIIAILLARIKTNPKLL